MKKIRFSLKILSLLCVITLLFTSCLAGTATLTVKFTAIQNEYPTYTGDEYHKSDEKSFEPVCKSGLIELLFDKKTMTTAIHDSGSDTLWTTLPQSSVTKEINSSAVEIELSNGSDTVYTLNSQDNSVNFGNAEYTVLEDGVSVKYSMSLDAESGRNDITTASEKEIRADITVLYTLKDGSFYVNMSMNSLSLPNGVYLEKIRLMNNFGAYENSGSEDYIFVPDGSGALIMTGISDSEFAPIDLAVYGNDVSAAEKAADSECLVGAFGIKRGNGAFLCIIEQGDSIAHINAYRNGEYTLNSVYASFNTTDIGYAQTEKVIKKTYGYQSRNDITMCYRFLSGKSATYSGMATACRENLIRSSVLSTKTVEAHSKDIPLAVTIQGGYVSLNGKYNALSSYSQTQTLASLLKAKGVNNVYLRYNGLYGDANNGSNNNFGNFKSSLGKKSDYEALYSYLNSQQFLLFADTDILSFAYDSSNSAKSVLGAKIQLECENTAFPMPTSSQGFAKLSDLEDKIEDILSRSEYISFDGYALNDVGNVLYSDYSADFYSRESAKKLISSQTSVLATAKKLMIDTGNFYAIKGADVVANIPMHPLASPERAAYKGIPFVQMMLHGISEYSAAGINTSDDIQTSFLKSVEYGCLPSVDWYCVEFDEKLDEKYYYDKNINEIVSYYIKANEIFSDLRDMRMTAHFEVQDGLYCVEYNNSAKVYVNYTDKPITVNGITVSSLDCVRVS